MLPGLLLRAIPAFLVFVLALLFAGAHCLGQDGDGDGGAPADDAVEFDPEILEPYQEKIDELIVHALTEGKAYATLIDLCTTAPHRLSGSEGAAKAVEWAQNALRVAGCDKVAKRSAKDRDGATALDRARRNKDSEIADLLK